MRRFGAFSFALLIQWATSFAPLSTQCNHYGSCPRSSSGPSSSSSSSALYIFERISEEGISALVSAQSAAAKYQLETVTVPCLLQGLVQFPESSALQRTLQRYRITLRRVETAVAALYIGTEDRSQGWLAGFRSASDGEDRPFSGPVQAALTRAGKVADVADATIVSSHHVLLAVLEMDPQQQKKNKNQFNVTNESEAWEFLQSLGVMDVNVTATDFCTTLLDNLQGNGPELVTGVASSSNSPTLDSVGTDLTQQAMDGLLDPVYGRDAEIKSCVRTLLRRRKNCVCLIGDAGVGKTAIAEGVAQALAKNSETSPLREHRLISIELASLVAGTRYRGDFEERLQSIVKEVTDPATPPTILFLDEIHNLVGAGATEGGMDAANLLKPALARGQLQLIGATTISEYRKYIEKDAALERRLQPVFVKEPSVPATLDILTAVQPNYEQHHKVKYTAEALASAAELSERYINDRFLPDKALDLLDEAGALVVLQSLEDDADTTLEIDTESGSPLVTAETIASVLSEFTGIPLGQLQTKELDRLQHLETDMERRVKGQQRAVRGVARAIRRARSGLRDPQRPVASFLFCGPTGTGKTELCKTLAETYYGSEKDMIRIDMSEYMEKFSASRLTGPPPGYVGYEEGGQLTEAVRRASHSCILLDEIEKAHEDVLNVLLQVMEDGVLTDGKGRTVNFKNCVIVMTSNIGSRRILDFFRSGSKKDSSPAPTVTTTPPAVNNGQSPITTSEGEPKPMEPAEILQRMQSNPKVGNLLMKASTDPAIMEAIRTAMSGSPADLQRAAQENPDIASFLQEVWGELDNDKTTEPSSGLSALRGSLEDTMAQWDETDASSFVQGVANQMDPNHRYSELSDIVKEELEAAMKPELLNRIDDIVVFSPLSKTDLYAIAERNIGIIKGRASEEHALKVEIEDSLLAKVVEEGSANAEEFGARPMRRAAQRYIEDTLSEAIIGGVVEKNTKATLSLASRDSFGGNDSVRISTAGGSFEIEVESASGGIGSKSAQQRNANGIESVQVEIS